MAKKKKSEQEETEVVEGAEETKKVVDIDEQLNEEFGDGVMVSGAFITEQPQVIIPVSPQIDIMTNGGIPFGSFIIPTGPPKVGKTSTSLDLAATALHIPTEFENPRHIYYFKVEGRLPPRDLLGIHHLSEYDRVNNMTIIQSRLGRILYAEDYLDIAERLINEKPGSIFIMDSMSQLCSKSRKEKDWQEDKAYRDNVPTFLSNFCKRICQVIPLNQSLFIGITHQIANTGMGFSAWAESSGNKVQYQVDVKMHAKFNQPYTIGTEANKIKLGININWECYAAPLQNGQSTEKSTSKFRFGWGLDKHAELILIAADLRLINVKGSWYGFKGDNGEDVKAQGLENTRTLLLENPKSALRIYKEFRELMGLKAIPETYEHICL